MRDENGKMTADENSIPADDQTVDNSASAEQKPPVEQAVVPVQPENTEHVTTRPLEPTADPPVRVRVQTIGGPPLSATNPTVAPTEPMGAPPERVRLRAQSIGGPSLSAQSGSTSASPPSEPMGAPPERVRLRAQSIGGPSPSVSAPTEPVSVPPESMPVEPSIVSAQPVAAQTSAPADVMSMSEKLELQNNCRHEYVRIYQRRLKGLDRRLVATRAYLPVGFKLGDFGHLSEGSYCFCTKCRKRLFPKRSQGEKEQARLERQQAKIAGVAAAFAPRSLMGDEDDESILSDNEELGLDEEESAPVFEERVDEDKMTVEVTVDELEVESVDVEDIKAEGVKLVAEDGFEESCELIEDVDS